MKKRLFSNPFYLKKFTSALLSLAGALILSASAQAGVHVEYGSTWRYLIGTREPSTPSTLWRSTGFEDNTWSSGATAIGYSTSPDNPAEQALVTKLPSSQESAYTSLYLRKTFNLSSTTGATELVLNVQVDDGYVAWLNGVEIARYNAPAGELPYNTPAQSAGEAFLHQTTITQNVGTLLRVGENVLAVMVLNADYASSDLVFDATLSSNLDTTPPVVVQPDPAPGIVQELNAIGVVFDEPVQGVDASDLLINGVPAQSFTAASPLNYTFTFPEPNPGQVTVQWAANHGITDLATTPNAFAGGSWNYTLAPAGDTGSVIISEFLADNENGIRDEDGTRSDWIEMYNLGDVPANLEGWYLTDSALDLRKWQFPPVVIQPNSYLLVWASDKNRTNNIAWLHTNFRLSRSGSYLALVNPSGTVVSEFAPRYPEQIANTSYGRDANDPTIVGFFPTPTPRARNTSGGAGFAPDPVFSVKQGVFTDTVTVELSAPSGQVRYTLDGSVPGPASPLYSTPIAVTTSTTIKARVFQEGVLPSTVIAQNYVILDSTVANFTSNLPLLIFSTRQRGVVDHPPQGAPGTYTMMLAIDPRHGRSSPLADPHFFGQAEISIRGQTSAGFPKRPYRLEIQDAYRNDLGVGLFGLPPDADWILNNPYSDKPFIQNFLAQELYEKMGNYAVRRKFVEVFLNTAGGKITYPRDYMGVYLLLEKIEINNERVDIARLGPEDTTEPDITGGYMWKKDKDTAGDRNFFTVGGSGFSGQSLKVHEPKPTEITATQLAWLRNHLIAFERSLYTNTWLSATGTNHYSHYIDVDSFVDQHWIVEFTKQIDGYRLSNYMHKDRGGKIKMSPIWDWNLSFGNADYLDGFNPTGWYYRLIGENEHIWLRRLIAGSTSPTGTTGDPDFNQKIADRWSVLRTNVFNSTNVLARVDELAAMLDEAANRDFQRWRRLGTYIWPNPPMYSQPTTYAGIIANMKKWISDRYKWIDTQFLVPPTISVSSGVVRPGTTVEMAAAAGDIYYTLDGSDPRAKGGALASNAIRYNGTPITVNENARIFARLRNGVRWSGPAAASLLTSPIRLVVSEIMYHPTAPDAATGLEDNDFEFVEFLNAGVDSIALADYTVSEGIQFTFPAITLAANQRVLIVRNRAAFESRYGTSHNIAGEYAGTLSNQGERLVVKDNFGAVVADFTYDTDWFKITDGAGFSLALLDEKGSPESWSTAAGWRPSKAAGGTPGDGEAPLPLFPRVVINEILSNTAANEVDTVELKNLSVFPADISGWYLTDNMSNPTKYKFPSGTIIPPGGIRVVTQFDAAFGFSSLGEEVFIFSANASGELTGYMHGFSFGPQRQSFTFGRHADSQGNEYFVTLAAPSLGAENGAPAVPPVVISEIHFHPPDVIANGQAWNNTEDEYIELHNRSANPVNLYDPAHPANTWLMEGQAEFSFPPNTTIPAGGYLVLVTFDPQAQPTRAQAFRTKFNIPQGVPLMGPFSGSLDNVSGTLSLSQPDAPITSGSDAGTVPYLLAEKVDYSGNSPWPWGADGLGFSLTRSSAGGFGSDPANWVATLPSPGRAPTGPAGINITQQPSGVFTPAGEKITLSVTASGAPQLSYQWRHNGKNLEGATGANLVLNNPQAAQSGQYDVLVYNNQGAVISSPAQVTVFADEDDDGIDDEWEFTFGGSPFSAADATQDYDNDGMSNRDEFLAGTNPRDGASALFLDEGVAPGSMALVFTAAAHRSYVIEYTDSLVAPEWKVLRTVPASNSHARVELADQLSHPDRYYRIVLQTP